MNKKKVYGWNRTDKEYYAITDWIENVLMSIGIMPNLDGFYQIVDSVIIRVSHSNCRITTDTYALLASVYNTQSGNIERNIRSAINQAFRNKTLIKINSLLGIDVMNETYCLTNSQLISILANFAFKKLLPSYNLQLGEVAYN